MQHRMTVGADRHKVFLIVNLVVFANRGNRRCMMNMNKSMPNRTISFLKIHSTYSTSASLCFDTFISCDAATFISV